MQVPPDVTIVIPCRDAESTISAQLVALSNQVTTRTFEIVVSDNGSTDRSASIVSRHAEQVAGVRIVDSSRAAGINVARNEGVLASRSRYILFCDADDVVPESWIERMSARLEVAPCVGGGAIHVADDGREIDRVLRLQVATFAEFYYPIGANCGVRREVFDAVDGFDESLRGGGDEVDFFYRCHLIGYNSEFVENAAIQYRVRPTVTAMIRQFYRYGRGDAVLVKRRRSLKIAARSSADSVLRLGQSLGGAIVGGGKNRRRRGVQGAAFHVGRLIQMFRRSARPILLSNVVRNTESN